MKPTVLPINQSPFITSKLFVAYQCSIFQTAERMPWFINKFHNIIQGYESRTLRYDHVHTDEWFCNEKAAHKQYFLLGTEILEYESVDIIAMIEKLISEGYYLAGNFNPYYISTRKEYKNLDTNIPYFIYGFCSKRKEFLALGNTLNERYSPYSILYDDYIQGLKHRNDKLMNFNFVKLNEDFKYNTNLNEIYNGTKDYLNSENSADKMKIAFNMPKYQYGIKCYHNFIAYVKFVQDFFGYIEPSHYQVFLEHHMLVQNRIQYLCSVGLIQNKALLMDSKLICDMAQDVRILCTRYNQTHSYEIIGKIADKALLIVDKEISLLEDFLVEVKRNL